MKLADRPAVDVEKGASAPQLREEFVAQWSAFGCPPSKDDRRQRRAFEAWEGEKARADLAQAGLLNVVFPATSSRWQYWRLMADLCKLSNLYRATAAQVAWQLSKFDDVAKAAGEARRIGKNRLRGMPKGRLRNVLSSCVSDLFAVENRIRQSRESLWRVGALSEYLRDEGRTTGPDRGADINGWFQREVFRSLDWFLAPASSDSIPVKRRTLARLVILTYLAADLAKCRERQAMFAIPVRQRNSRSTLVLHTEQVERNVRGLRQTFWHEP